MSAIFKDRKIPRHLIIEDDYEQRLRKRHRWGGWLSVAMLLGMLAMAALQVFPVGGL